MFILLVFDTFVKRVEETQKLSEKKFFFICNTIIDLFFLSSDQI